MPRSLQLVFSVVIVALLVGAPMSYKRQRELRFRNFRVVEDGVLYRSGQLDLNGLKRLVHDYGIKTIVSLRDADDAADLQEVDWAGNALVNHVRIPPRVWSASADGTVPAEEGLAVFRQVMDDPANHPVLIHCFAGIHRTGTYCAVYRMDYQQWSSCEAIAELRASGYATLDGDLDILSFLERYRPELERYSLRMQTRLRRHKHDFYSPPVGTPNGISGLGWSFSAESPRSRRNNDDPHILGGRDARQSVGEKAPAP